MPVPGRNTDISRSRSWDAAGWYEGSREGDVSSGYRRAAGVNDSLTYNGEEAFNKLPSGRSRDILDAGSSEIKEDLSSYPDAYIRGQRGHRDRRPARKNSVPDFSFPHERQMATSGRGTLQTLDYYNDPSLLGRSPEDPRYYRDPIVNRAGNPYGPPTGRTAWEQAPARLFNSQEVGRTYRDPTGRIVTEGQRSRSRDSSPARYAVDLPNPRYGSEASAFLNRPTYNETTGRQTAPTCLVVESSESAATDGTLGTSFISANRGYGSVRDNVAAKTAYDSYDGTLPPSHPQGPGPLSVGELMRAADMEFLATLRSEGLSEATVSTLIQQGFDTPSSLAVMEEHDVKSAAANLGQARLLSGLIKSYRADLQMLRQDPQKSNSLRSRARSNSFSHRGDLMRSDFGAQPLNNPTMDGFSHAQHSFSLQPTSPRTAELDRRPSSAPSQHLLETAGYPLCGTNSQYAVQRRPASAYPAQSGIPMTVVHANVTSGPKTAYPTSYTVPMELMKRERLPPTSPMHSPHCSPQLLSKHGTHTESAMSLPPPATHSQHSLHSPYQKVTRRTGPPIIVSTMASPEPSNYPKLFACFKREGSLIFCYNVLFLLPCEVCYVVE